MKALLPIVMLCLAACAASEAEPIASAEELSACGVDGNEHARLMALSVDDFDQDFDGGWRKIAYEDGCDRAAASVVVDYIDRHDLDASEHGVVFWHVGQLLAGAGDYARAKTYLEQSFNPEPDDIHEREWATYARGTIAFLDGDRDALEAAITELSRDDYAPSPERVAAMVRMSEEQNISFPEGAMEKPLNLIALEGLRACFGRHYSEAYGQCDAAD